MGYAPNPGFKRGQTYKGLAWLKRNDSSQVSADEAGSELTPDGSGAVDKKAVRKGSKWAAIESVYRLQEIKLGKLGIEDFPFHKYNQTNIGGLENTIPNSYANAWLSTMVRCQKSPEKETYDTQKRPTYMLTHPWAALQPAATIACAQLLVCQGSVPH